MASIALKVDVDTDRGTAEGVPRLARELERLGVRATFLFSLGPDNTGRAMRRVFRRGFLTKVRRTSVIQHYGLRTLLYGTLLPAPDIGRRRAGIMRSVASAGFEVGVHTYDHVKWQDCVGDANYPWTCWQLQLAVNAFGEVFGRAPRVHGAAGWQVNKHVPALEETHGFLYASDTRGTSPFLPWADGITGSVPQLPTTLPTLDELVGRPDVPQDRIADHVLGLTRTSTCNQVFTLHAELEGGAYLPLFVSLLQGWRAQGHVLGDLAAQVAAQRAPLAVHSIHMEEVPGRSGVLAVQGAQVPEARLVGHPQ